MTAHRHHAELLRAAVRVGRQVVFAESHSQPVCRAAGGRAVSRRQHETVRDERAAAQPGQRAVRGPQTDQRRPGLAAELDGAARGLARREIALVFAGTEKEDFLGVCGAASDRAGVGWSRGWSSSWSSS